MPSHWTEFVEDVAGEDRLLSWKAVQKETGLSRTTAWRLQKDGQFPSSVVLSPGRVGYRQREIEAWKRSRVPRREMGSASPPTARSKRVVTQQVDAPPPPLLPPRGGPVSELLSESSEAAAPARRRGGPVNADQLALEF